MLSGGLNEVIFLKSTWSAANSFNFDGFSNSSTWPIILRVVQTQAMIFLKSMSERVGSDKERLLN